MVPPSHLEKLDDQIEDTMYRISNYRVTLDETNASLTTSLGELTTLGQAYTKLEADIINGELDKIACCNKVKGDGL